MNTYDEYSEEELNDYNIQISIQDSCHERFLKTSARYDTPSFTKYLFLNAFIPKGYWPVLPPLNVSLSATTDENLRVLAAIEQGKCIVFIFIQAC